MNKPLNLMTFYHSKFNALQLTRQVSSDNIEKLSPSLFNATVDLNPHQLDAALFAFRSPLSRGAILADEVGLGKTIEAGIVISQLWAERKRKILVVCPTTLRKQWAQELWDKFFIASSVFDAKEYNTRRKRGQTSPLLTNNEVVICSYNFVQSKEAEIMTTKWDLVVIDEAHRLRNVYKSGNKIASAIKRAIQNRPTLLLTATPLQNTLMELYGLVSFLDEHLFGDQKAFRERYVRSTVGERDLRDLRNRLRPLCQRTLRRQVTEYVKFTNRIPITQDFTPNDDEQTLYDKVSEYLQRDKLNALPPGQRKLMTLILRKLLASSTFAISRTLQAFANRLIEENRIQPETIEETLETDFENFDEIAEEWNEDADEKENEDADEKENNVNDEIIEEGSVAGEIQELLSYSDLASSIRQNAKGEALLQALESGFIKLTEIGANRKAVIFTESRRTQDYLFEHLTENGYAGKVMTINGTNSDASSKQIYLDWVERHKGETVVTGNKAVDIRAAIVEHFRQDAEILIATEAAAEGVNLQFCSLVVNYDLPWNPQRIEQRIGRCHRYGQKHDVVVINFLNRRNAADQRVFELLSEKFRLFDGVFGSSDEVLGALESGVDFERRIVEIYQSCRTQDEIETAFNHLQTELEEQISARMADTRNALLENFDDEVHQRLRLNRDESAKSLNQFERSLWNLTKIELTDSLGEKVLFDDDNCGFVLEANEIDGLPIESGLYRFARNLGDTQGVHAYTLNSPLAETLLNKAGNRQLEPVEIVFDYTNTEAKVGLVEQQIGNSGWLKMRLLKINALEEEDRVLCAVIDDDGNPLHEDFGEKLFQVDGRIKPLSQVDKTIESDLDNELNRQENGVKLEIAERNSKFFDDELDKLERWAEDRKQSLEYELKDLDLQIKNAKRESKLAVTLESKLDWQKHIKKLEQTRKQKRSELFEAQDKVDADKDELLENIEARLKQEISNEPVFTVRWTIV